MDEDKFAGFVRNPYYGEPKEEVKEIKPEEIKNTEDWKKEANRRLEETNQGIVVVNKKSHTFFKAFFYLCILIAIGFALYMVWEGKLQSMIDQPININNNIQPPTNNFNPTNNIANSYNIHLNATINLPENLTIKNLKIANST